MTAGKYEFRIRPLPTLIMLILVTLFSSLGAWQLQRADYKRELARIMVERSESPPVMIEHDRVASEDLRYRHAVAVGSFDADRQFYIENRRHGSRTGFHVITPLRIARGDALLLVNRGWVEAPAGGGLPESTVPEGEVTVTGLVYEPSLPAITLHGGADAARGWGSRWPYMTVELFRATVDVPVVPMLLLLDRDAPHGYIRDWPREEPKVGMHIGYAIQWFAFALIVIVIYLRLSLSAKAVMKEAP
jgi:surfeit locus 1 family protein